MIIKRYVTREISRPFIVIAGLCGVIFASYTTAVILSDVAAGLISPATVARLVLIKLLIALEILLPVSLYFGIVFGLGRMHSDGELVALSAGGVGEARLFLIVLRFSLVIALLVACVSLFARPWAYQQQYLMRAEVAAKFDIADLEAKNMLVGSGSDYAVFADSVDHLNRTAEQVIVEIRKADAIQIVVAQRLLQVPVEEAGPLAFIFEKGTFYRLDRNGTNDLIGKFGKLRLTLAASEPRTIGYKSKAASILVLGGSSRPQDVAEFQWRLSTPAATVLIALLAVPLSRGRPRQGRFAKALAAVLAYAIFFNLMSFAKNLVQEGLVGTTPGLWWPLALLGLLLWVLMWRPWRLAHA